MRQNCSFDTIVILAAKDTEKATRIVATSFYKVLRKNGFTDEQIVNVSSCILDCLLQSLREYKRKSIVKAESGTLRKKKAIQEPGETGVQTIRHAAACSRSVSDEESSLA